MDVLPNDDLVPRLSVWQGANVQVNTRRCLEHKRAGGSRELIALFPDQSFPTAQQAFFYDTLNNSSAAEIVQSFPYISSFGWVNSIMSLSTSFLSQLCEGFSARHLTRLTLSRCGLTRLPRQIGLLVELSGLSLDDNDILWVHYSLARSLTNLSMLNLLGNRRLEHLGYAELSNHAQSALGELCVIDASHRGRILCFAGILRKRRFLARDVVMLLAKALFELRSE